MAAAPKKKPVATGKSIANYDAKLAEMAKLAHEQEARTGGEGKFFSTKGGILAFQDNKMPQNRMAVIILDHVMENTYYEGAYDPDNPSGPTCFAFGRDERVMVPHEIVREAGQDQHVTCQGCPMNEFGSADTGRGKACKNSRRLALISAGTIAKDDTFELIEDPDHYETAEPAFLKLPVTSIKGFAGYVKQLATNLKRPPFAVVTMITVVPDEDSQFKVVFESIDEVPNSLLDVIIAQHEKIKATIEFPYQLDSGERAPAKKAPARGKVAPKSKVKPKAKGRY